MLFYKKKWKSGKNINYNKYWREILLQFMIEFGLQILINFLGNMAEWSKAFVLKTNIF